MTTEKYNSAFDSSARDVLGALFEFAQCQRKDGSVYGIADGKKCVKGTETAKWEELAKGNYGAVYVDREKGLVRKINNPGKSFGEHEAKLQKLMGDAGFSPKLHKATDSEMIMDLAKGKTIWKDYRPGEGEAGVKFSDKQANAAAKAVLFLHKKGYAHGDMHSLQWMVSGDKPMLLDFGLAKKTSEEPRKAMQDWTKGGAFMNLSAVKGSGGEKIRDLVGRYKEAGTSKPAKDRIAKQEEIAREYLAWVESL
jgi:tRNA A-37 threonylcarbamoyl transferase component Bud32